MKKILAFVLLFTFSVSLFAEELTREEKRFRGQIENYVKEEGYAPYIDTDETVTFKNKGELFWIAVDEYKKGFYVTMTTSISIEDANLRNALIAADEAQSNWKFLQIHRTSNKKSFLIRVNGYFTSISQFKDLFSSWLYILEEGKSDLEEKYESL